MGIEVELSVPVSSAPGPAPVGAASVEHFLGGGVQEGTPIHPLANGFRTEGDHDDVGREVETARNLLTTNPAYTGPVIAPPPFRVGNLEYVTLPFDEELPASGPVGISAGGRAEFQTTVHAVATDMVAKVAAARAGIQAIPGTALRLGVPTAAEWAAFTGAYGLTPGFGVGARNAIVSKINNLGELQVTAGIRQEKLAQHLQTAAANPWLVGATGGALAQLQTAGAVNAAAQVLATTPGLTPAQRGSAALQGYLSLIIQYAYGHFTYRSGTVGKNLAVFLSKFPMHRVQQEMDRTIRPRSMTRPLRAALRATLINVVWTRVNQPDVVNIWNSPVVGGENGGALGNWRLWVRTALSGAGDAFSHTQITPARYIDPTDHVRSPVLANPGPERPAARNVAGVHKAGVIPLEFRHMGAFAPATLWGAVNTAITHVRAVNA